MYSLIKRKVYLLLDPSEGGTRWDRVINTLIISLIILNTTAVIVETVQHIYDSYKFFFNGLELFTVIIFSVEYVLRVWSYTSSDEYKDPVSGRLKYIFSLGGLIDLAAILPFYLPFVTKIDLRFIRMLRLFRFLRFLKLGRYLHASKLISRVIASKKEELILSLGITILLIIVASCMMYYAEHDAQPDKFSSIPETMWWSVATLTTVGYGDVFPITILGKTLTAIISILGIGMFALPAGILASGFSDEFKSHKHKKVCPHCGKELED
jgi:Ion transport protein.